MASANFPLANNANLGQTAALWLKVFQSVPDDEMVTAMNLCLLNCKNFPTVKDLQDALNELRADARTEPKTQGLPPPRSRWTSPAAQKAFEMVKQGKAKEYIASMDITDVDKYARSKFPDISDDMIRKNYAELKTAMRSVELCKACMWDTAQCPSAGAYFEPFIMPEGYVKLEAAFCHKKKGA